MTPEDRKAAEREVGREPCPNCHDSGYVESIRGGFWTGERVITRLSICDCACGDDVRRERAATSLTQTEPAHDR